MWKLEIERVENGYILKGKFNGAEEETSVVVAEGENEFSDLESMRDLLYQIKEYFGVYYSKHSKRNIVINQE